MIIEHRTRETDSWRAQTKSCVHQDPEERSSYPRRDCPDLPVSVQESPVEVCAAGGLQGQTLSVSVRAWDLLKEVDIIYITSTIVWSQAKQ